VKARLLKLHRWIALLFALPLLLVVASGLVLSFEPWLVVESIGPKSLTSDRVAALLDRHDPAGQARMLAYRSYDRTVTISVARNAGKVVDVATGEVLSAPSFLATALGVTRRLHEKLLIDAGWLVVGSTVAMLAVAILGLLLGLPRVSNTLSGWHKGMAWSLLPFILLSPLSGLALAFGITFATPAGNAPSARGPAVTLAEAVRIVGERHDLSTLVWLRPLGGRMVARLAEGGEYRLYTVTPQGTAALSRNWPRLWHEGNFAGPWSALLNVVVSVALIGLLATGTWMWARRQLRRRMMRQRAAAA
jgi:uncharacterized iron-regulated membrane protein